MVVAERLSREQFGLEEEGLRAREMLLREEVVVREVQSSARMESLANRLKQWPRRMLVWESLVVSPD